MRLKCICILLDAVNSVLMDTSKVTQENQSFINGKSRKAVSFQIFKLSIVCVHVLYMKRFPLGSICFKKIEFFFFNALACMANY